MRIVAAIGGNALLRRGEVPSAAAQRANLARAADALASIAADHELVVTHGNGPQVGLLALQAASDGAAWPLDVLGAECEGMIGYQIEQALSGRLPPGRGVCTLLTMVEVDAEDPGFAAPTKPIGPVYAPDIARRLADENGWQLVADGDGLRRVVASPRPRRIVELSAIRLLMEAGNVVICAGGIPVLVRDGALVGVEAVIDKDHAAGLLARDLGADMLLLLTDVDAVYREYGTPAAEPIPAASPDAIDPAAFPAGTMRPKVEAACDFVRATGGIAAIGSLDEVGALMAGRAGTRIAA